MALAEAMLTCLAEGPLTGYELAKTFDTSIGFFWRADHQQIYRELKRLRGAGLVDAELVVQQGRPNKSVYSITEAGLARLLAWSRERSDPPSIKDDMMVKLYALDHVDLDAMRAQIADRLGLHRERLVLYRRIERRYAELDPADLGRCGKLLGLDLGIVYESGWVQWCERALERLDALAKARPPR